MKHVFLGLAVCLGVLWSSHVSGQELAPQESASPFAPQTAEELHGQEIKFVRLAKRPWLYGGLTQLVTRDRRILRDMLIQELTWDYEELTLRAIEVTPPNTRLDTLLFTAAELSAITITTETGHRHHFVYDPQSKSLRPAIAGLFITKGEFKSNRNSQRRVQVKGGVTQETAAARTEALHLYERYVAPEDIRGASHEEDIEDKLPDNWRLDSLGRGGQSTTFGITPRQRFLLDQFLRNKRKATAK